MTDNTLQELRQRIDKIDDTIIDLLKQRLEIVKKVGSYKQQTSQSQSFIRAGREATMLRNLTKKMAGSFPPAAVGTIWRMIISTSLSVEQHLNIAAFVTNKDQSAYWQAREYYGTFLPIIRDYDCNSIIDKVAKNEISVGILPLIDNPSGPWWVRPNDEKNDIYVFARIPFVEDPDNSVSPTLAIANTVPEPTNDDISLIAITCDDSKEKINKICENCGLKTNFLAESGSNFLIEINKFIKIDDSEFLQLVSQFGLGNIRLLGSYAVPISL